jgi:hypothetical protein
VAEAATQTGPVAGGAPGLQPQAVERCRPELMNVSGHLDWAVEYGTPQFIRESKWLSHAWDAAAVGALLPLLGAAFGACARRTRAPMRMACARTHKDARGVYAP